VPTTIFLPILTRARELDSRLMLAARLCRDGHVCYMGLTRTLTAIARETRPSIYLQPILNTGSEGRLREMRGLGHWILGWDEEGLVYPSGAWYRDDRVGSGTLDSIDLFVTWGARQRRDLGELERSGDRNGPRIVNIGNPRADMLRAPYRAAVDAQAAELRERLGRFVLINTNFDLVNHLDGGAVFQRRLRDSGYFAEAGGAARLRRWAEYRRFMLTTFLAGIPGFLRLIGDRTVVLRPHPSEDPAPWRDLADCYPQLRIEPAAGSVLPWLAAADALIHNSCTTAVEAFALGTPVIAIHPPGLDRIAESPLPNALSHRVPDWAEAARLVTGGGIERSAEQERLLASHIADFPRQDCIETLGRLCAGAARRLAPPGRVDPAAWARDDIGMITKRRDENSRLPPFDDAAMAEAERVLVTSPHGPARLERVHDHVIAVSPA